MRGCSARQESDELYCYRCKLRWDVNDPDPPQCRDGRKPTSEESINEIRRLLKDEPNTGH